jgi:hypothetical protein
VLAKDKSRGPKVKLLRRMIKAKILQCFSTGFLNLIESLTKVYSEDRCTPQEGLNTDCFKASKSKTATELIDLLLVSVETSSKLDKDMELEKSNMFMEKLLNSLAIMYETAERWYELDNNSQNPHSSQEFSFAYSTIRRGKLLSLNMESEQIVELSQELGCPKQMIWSKLKKCISG